MTDPGDNASTAGSGAYAIDWNQYQQNAINNQRYNNAIADMQRIYGPSAGLGPAGMGQFYNALNTKAQIPGTQASSTIMGQRAQAGQGYADVGLTQGQAAQAQGAGALNFANAAQVNQETGAGLGVAKTNATQAQANMGNATATNTMAGLPNTQAQAMQAQASARQRGIASGMAGLQSGLAAGADFDHAWTTDAVPAMQAAGIPDAQIGAWYNQAKANPQAFQASMSAMLKNMQATGQTVSTAVPTISPSGQENVTAVGTQGGTTTVGTGGANPEMARAFLPTPEGSAWGRDEQGNMVQYHVPGSKAYNDTATGVNDLKVQNNNLGQLAQRADVGMKQLDTLNGMLSGLSSNLNMRGLREAFPATSEAKMEELLKGIRGNAALGDLASVKEGQGLSMGRVTNTEMNAASEALGALDPKLPVGVIRQNVMMLRNYFQTMRSNLDAQRGYNEQSMARLSKTNMKPAYIFNGGAWIRSQPSGGASGSNPAGNPSPYGWKPAAPSAH